jgi:predicted Zn finger-like uncharacterized protein
MLIVCPSCATSYDVELASLQPDGRQVRCVRCRTVWRAAPSQADMLLAAAAAIAPARDDALVPAGSFAEEPAPPPADEAASNGPMAEPPADAADPAPAAGDISVVTDDLGSPAEVEAPPIAPTDLDAGRPPIEIEAEATAEQDAEPLEDIETYAARRQRRGFRRPSLRWPLSNLQSGILALLIADAILIGWRSDFVRIFPQTASFYATLGLPVNLRGLAFDGVATTTEQHEGVPILVVEGGVVNDSRRIADVPRLKFVVRNAAHEEIYSWTAVPPRAALPPGEAVAFRSRLASPPPDGRDILVRFVTRHDIIAGTR